MPILTPSPTPASVAWLDWAERLSIRLKACPTILIADELRECAIRFYRDTRTWRSTGVALATTVAATADYTVTVPTNAALAGLPAVWLDGVEISESTPGEEADYEPDETGTPELVGITGAATIHLTPTPGSAGAALTATVAYCPSDDSTGILQSLYFNHRDTIEAMTLASIMTQPEKPWTNFSLASLHASDARRGALYDSTMAGPLRRSPLSVKPW